MESIIKQMVQEKGLDETVRILADTIRLLIKRNS